MQLLFLFKKMSRRIVYSIVITAAIGLIMTHSIINFVRLSRELESQKVWLGVEINSFEAFKLKSLNHSVDTSQAHKEDVQSRSQQSNVNLWQGCDPVAVHRHWPGLMLDGDYMLREFVDPDDPRAFGMGNKPKTIEDMTDGDAEERFHQLVTVNHLHCANKRRMGKFADGGWDVCVSAPYTLEDGCIVYSFGINFDFSFDDGISEIYGCQVRSYDPSMNNNDHQRSDKVTFYKIGLGPENVIDGQGWKLRTLQSLFEENGDDNKITDYLKIDIELNEWKSLKEILGSHTLKNVKQFAIEIHVLELYGHKSSKSDLLGFYDILLGLEKQGFRRYKYHENPQGGYLSQDTNKERPCCYELYYLNINFLK